MAEENLKHWLTKKNQPVNLNVNFMIHTPEERDAKLIDWVKVLRPTRYKMGYFGDILSQSLGIVLKKLNLTQQKHTYTNKLQHKIIPKAKSNIDKL